MVPDAEENSMDNFEIASVGSSNLPRNDFGAPRILGVLSFQSTSSLVIARSHAACVTTRQSHLLYIVKTSGTVIPSTAGISG